MSPAVLMRRIGWVGLWLGVVVVCGGLTWVTIGYAVRQADGDRSWEPRAVATGSVTDPPAVAPPAPPASSLPASSPPASPPAVSPSATAPVAVVAAAHASVGGTVVAACRGGRLELRSLTPRDGWGFSTQRSSGGVRVTWREADHAEEGRDQGESRDHNEEDDSSGSDGGDSSRARVRVYVTCAAGRPAYRLG